MSSSVAILKIQPLIFSFNVYLEGSMDEVWRYIVFFFFFLKSEQ